MKSPLVPTLLLALLICIGALFLQHRHHQTLAARQDQTIAQLRAETATLRQQTELTRQLEARRQLSRAALAQARALAPRYASLQATSTGPAAQAKKSPPRTYSPVSR